MPGRSDHSHDQVPYRRYRKCSLLLDDPQVLQPVSLGEDNSTALFGPMQLAGETRDRNPRIHCLHAAAPPGQLSERMPANPEHVGQATGWPHRQENSKSMSPMC